MSASILDAVKTAIVIGRRELGRPFIGVCGVALEDGDFESARKEYADRYLEPGGAHVARFIETHPATFEIITANGPCSVWRRSALVTFAVCQKAPT